MKRVTLLTGRNNVGKSALLEAMFVHSGNFNPNLLMVINALRGMATYTLDLNKTTGAPWRSVFHHFDDSQPIKLSADVSHDGKQAEPITVSLTSVVSASEISGLSASLRGQLLRNAVLGPSKILRLDYTKGRKVRDSDKHRYHLFFDEKQAIVTPQPPSPEFIGRLISAATKDQPNQIAQNFAKFQMGGITNLLTDALRILEPRLKSLEMVFDGEPILHGDIGLSNRRLVPLPLMGDGLNRVAALILAIGNSSGGTVFVDDIDTGLHYSIMKEFWTAALQAAIKFDVQIIATTHSAECAEGAMEAAKASDHADDFSVIRLERQQDKIAANYYSASDFFDAIDAGLEVR